MHRETEIVVVLAADHAGQRAVLQLRRGEDRHPDIAREAAAAGRDLEGIAIDQPHPRIGADQDAAVIDVGDDGALGVHRGEGARHVGRDAHEEAPVGAREGSAAALRAVELVDVAMADHARASSRRSAGRPAATAARCGHAVSLLERRRARGHHRPDLLPRAAPVAADGRSGRPTPGRPSSS